MENISTFDMLENLRFSRLEIEQKIESLKTDAPGGALYLLNALSNKISSVASAWEDLCDDMAEQACQAELTTVKLKNHLDIETRNFKMKEREHRMQASLKANLLKQHEEELTQSLYRIRDMWSDDLSELDFSLQEQVQARVRLEIEQQSYISQVEEKMQDILKTPEKASEDLAYIKLICEDAYNSLENRERPIKEMTSYMPSDDRHFITVNGSYISESNISAMFDILMDELTVNEPNPNSISIEKTIGGWASEYDSQNGSLVYDIDDIDEAIGKVREAGLLSEFQLQRLENMSYDQFQDSGRMDAVKQMLSLLLKQSETVYRSHIPENSRSFNAPFASPSHFQTKKPKHCNKQTSMASPNLSIEMGGASPKHTAGLSQSSSFLVTLLNELNCQISQKYGQSLQGYCSGNQSDEFAIAVEDFQFYSQCNARSQNKS